MESVTVAELIAFTAALTGHKKAQSSDRNLNCYHTICSFPRATQRAMRGRNSPPTIGYSTTTVKVEEEVK
jgi:hypothetical protein